MNPSISIIIPTYNSSTYLSGTIQSVLDQSFRNFECIVIDDGSTDNTLEIINEFKETDNRILFFQRKSDRLKGANACRNIGIEQAKGDYVMFLDSDDILKPTCLEQRVQAFNSDSDLDAVIADTGFLIGGEFRNKALNIDTDDRSSEGYLFLFLNYELPWHTSSPLWRRDSVKDVKFDESLTRFQDVDYHIRVLQTPKKLVRLNSIDGYYRVDPDKKFNRSHIELVLKNLKLLVGKHKDLARNDAERKAFRGFMTKLLYSYLLPNYYEFPKLSKSVLNELIDSDLMTNKHKRQLKFLRLMCETKLYRVKGIGMYRISNLIRKQLER